MVPALFIGVTNSKFTIFLKGEDNPDDVRSIRDLAINALAGGGQVEWTSENISFKKAAKFDDYERLIMYCNTFLRRHDPQVRRDNPIITKTQGDMHSPH